ncbi:MAG: divalent metal cation transporter [Pseudomonadota bacterium]
MSTNRFATSLKAIGPGILFAGAAIGVSHLVQSTRAGALFGLGLIGVVLLANLCKYPGMSFGARYSHATGYSMLEGYRRQGLWALIVFSVLTLTTMAIVTAAITLVTAAIFNEFILTRLFEGASLNHGCVVLMIIAAGLLKTGGYGWLDTMIKVLLSTMALFTFAATIAVLPSVEWTTLSLTYPQAAMTTTGIAFAVALAGWMPAPLDLSIWNSMWALAKQKQVGRDRAAQANSFDFNLGYALCVVMALCFVILGTVVMHQPGIEPANGGVNFAKQVLNLFTKSLGDWCYPFVGLSALAVMFSTTLTALDAYPRILVVLKDRFRSAEAEGEAVRDLAAEKGYWIGFLIVASGALVVLYGFLSNLKQLVDLATTLSFITTPVLALLNHRAMFSPQVEGPLRPSEKLKAYSAICIAVLSLFALFYLWLRFIR